MNRTLAGYAERAAARIKKSEAARLRNNNNMKVRRDLIAWFAGLPTARMKELKKGYTE